MEHWGEAPNLGLNINPASRKSFLFCYVVAITIFAVGAGVSIYKGVHHLFHPAAIQDPYLNYIVAHGTRFQPAEFECRF
jgi:hypothetical protein